MIGWSFPAAGPARKVGRLAAVVAASTLLVTGATVSVGFIGDGILHHSASAQELALAPLASTLQEGSTVYADDGTTVLAVLSASEYRKPVALSQVSAVMVAAVLDTEDHRFFLHGGFDIPSIVRALAADSSGDGLQGGSTITQQLVKQLYLTSERTIGRKIREAVIADRIAREYSKDQILQAYLNTVYFGNGAYGVEAAANTYFGEHASRLDLPQAALLAGLISNPSGYDPIDDPAAARDRRSEVLSRMEHYGDIDAAQVAAADAVALPTEVIAPPVAADSITDYYVQEVVDQLLGPQSPLGSSYEQRYESLFESGLKIYTNLDPRMQALAEQTVARDTPPNDSSFQEAMVAVDPATGRVRAMVGGAGFDQAHFDVITQGARQPGSGFKVFTLLAALERGYSIYDTVDGQSPCAIRFPGNVDLVEHPAHNDEGNGGGVMTLLDATAHSVNCAYLRLAHEVGLPNVIKMAQSLGITANLYPDGPEAPVPSLVIGSIAVHPIEMAAAYAAVADGGVYHRPTFIDRIVDHTGATIYEGTDPGRRVIPAWVDAEANVAFRAVVQYGTGTGAQLYGREVAGKTGTTNGNVDAWFNGFVPQLEATVWMGNVAGEVPMVDIDGVGQVYGGTFPATTWRDFMAATLAGQPALDFPSLDSALLPPSRYITSPSLVADDVLDHNDYGYEGCAGPYGFEYGDVYRFAEPYMPCTAEQNPPSDLFTSPTTVAPYGFTPPETVPRRRHHQGRWSSPHATVGTVATTTTVPWTPPTFPIGGGTR